MANNSIVLVGGPDSGKSNFIGRLWLALQSRKGMVTASVTPDDIKYVESIADHILQGRFAPRTEKEESKREFKITVKTPAGDDVDIIIPDVSGELWKKAVDTLEISQEWLSVVNNSSCALLFLRVLSDANVQPLDWVNSKQYLELGLGEVSNNHDLPTQVALLELLRFLEENLSSTSGNKPRVAIIITAWDLVNQEDAKHGPRAFLKEMFPLFEGRISDIQDIDVGVFASSILGGDFSIRKFVEEYQSTDIDNLGYVIQESVDGNEKKFDITLPIAWLLGNN